jgi:hypothetical protein
MGWNRQRRIGNPPGRPKACIDEAILFVRMDGSDRDAIGRAAAHYGITTSSLVRHMTRQWVAHWKAKGII